MMNALSLFESEESLSRRERDQRCFDRHHRVVLEGTSATLSGSAYDRSRYGAILQADFVAALRAEREK